MMWLNCPRYHNQLGSTYLKTYIVKFAAIMKPVFIKWPEGEHLLQIMETYSRLGFPGAIGSKDLTHITLGKCSTKFKNVATGK